MEVILDMKYDWFSSKIICGHPETLFKLAAIREAINLWHEEDTIKQMEVQQIKSQKREEEKNIQEKLREKIKQKKLPDCIKNEISQILELIVEQMFQFRRFFPDKLFNKIGWILLRDKICWTSQGTIDKRNTAEALADAIELNVEIKLQVAVLFYLSDRINSLSIQLPFDYTRSNLDSFLGIFEMNDVPIAKEHFNIPVLSTRPSRSLENYRMRLENLKNDQNDLHFYYHWQTSTEQEKFEFLNSDYFLKSDYYLNLRSFTNSNEDYSNFMLFLFTQCDKERKIQLLQNCCIFVKELLHPQWLPIFDACIIEILMIWTADSVVELLDNCTKRLRSTIAFKKKYGTICTNLLQCLYKDYPMTIILPVQSNKLLVNSLAALLEEGKIKEVGDFLNSINNKWIKEWFLLCDFNLAFFIKTLFKYGIFESVLLIAFPTSEDRMLFRENGVIYDITYHLILQFVDYLNDIDKILSLFLCGFEDLKNCKIKIAERKGCNLCYCFLRNGDWDSANKFVEWCFQTEEEIICFHTKFRRSQDFRNLLFPKITEKTMYAIVCFVSLVKVDSLGHELPQNEKIFRACVNIFSSCYRRFYYVWMDISLLLKAVDKFLLTFTTLNDPEILFNLKNKIFLDRTKKSYISFLIEVLNRIVKDLVEEEDYFSRTDDLWKEMVEDFFTWTCSSDEALKAEMEKEFWSSIAVLEAMESLKEIC